VIIEALLDYFNDPSDPSEPLDPVTWSPNLVNYIVLLPSQVTPIVTPEYYNYEILPWVLL